MNVKRSIPKGIIILIATLVFIIIILSSYIIYDKFINKRNDLPNDNNIEVVYNIIYDSNSQETFESKEIKLNNKNIDLKVTLDDNNYYLYINNNSILATHKINKVFIFNDLLMVDYNNSYHDSFNKLIGYNNDGKKVFDAYEQINDNTVYLYTFKLDDELENNKDSYYYIDKNTLYIYTSRISDMYINILNNKNINICEFDNEIKKGTLTKEYHIETLYSLKYKGNYKFEEPKIESSLNYQDLIELQDIKQYINECS